VTTHGEKLYFIFFTSVLDNTEIAGIGRKASLQCGDVRFEIYAYFTVLSLYKFS
jgi:hypothetical protein